MDEIDRKIIGILQDNARTSLKHIAEMTYLSSPAVSSRIDKLERRNVITGYHAKVDLGKLGYEVEAFVSVMVGKKDQEEFIREAEKMPNVLECRTVSGEYTMLLKTAFPDSKELEEFTAMVGAYGKVGVLVVRQEEKCSNL